MRIPRIYCAQPLAANASVALDPGPSQHLSRVLRMKTGDALTLFDGRGGEYPATITAISKKQVTANTGEHLNREAESPLSIHLGIAISRGERMDWVVQKATELGVTEITPLLSERTEVKLVGERADKKLRHWQNIASSACEQCGRNRVPVIHSLTGVDHWLASCTAERRFVLHHRAMEIDTGAETPGSVALLIGPEGGLSPEEIERAESSGFQSLRLGPRVLRTETAPLAAITLLQAWWGDLACTD